MTQISIYGAVNCNGREFQDDEIASLLPQYKLAAGVIGPYKNTPKVPKTGWNFAGDLDDEACCIVVDDSSGKDNCFAGKNALPECLSFLATIL